MCGIIGYTGKRQAIDALLSGLETLEYRGYDSSGITVLNMGCAPTTVRSSGKLNELKKAIHGSNIVGNTGIGHTRWATHGPATDENAHPHADCTKSINVVHNGIVENHLELRQHLQMLGHEFLSDTDSETIPHLIEEHLKDNLQIEKAVQETAKQLEGSNSVAMVSSNEPDKIFAFRTGTSGSLVVGLSENETFIASDINALTGVVTSAIYLSDNELTNINGREVEFLDLDGRVIQKTTSPISNETIASSKGTYRDFMSKEINEQPEAILNTFRERVSFNESHIVFPNFSLTPKQIGSIKRVVLTGMGTSLHAAMVGRYWIENIAGIPAEWENSSEFTYRNPILDPKTLFISISQSGETADTLNAMHVAKQKGATLLNICNYQESQAARSADQNLLINAGAEIGVAATKTFTCSLTTLYLLSIYMGNMREHIDKSYVDDMLKELSFLPTMIGSILKDSNVYKDLANKYYKYTNFLFLGRGINFPIAMEGALKLKEISYIHAEGYTAAEMKHGPISLIDKSMPVVVIAPQNSLYEKMINNISEVKARGGIVLAVVSDTDGQIKNKVDNIVKIPPCSEMLSPIVSTVPLQLLSYYIAMKKGCDVDQPRNLAKSVTVE
jgi:glucosamine--fructose-6-phosphate aminotransferase (isomerizing)